jgi:protein SCO1/2
MRRTWLLAFVALLALIGMGYSYVQLKRVPASALHGTTLKDPPSVDTFDLTTAAGKRVSLAHWQGKYLLVYFGYTRCPDVCPLTMGRLAKMYEDLGQPGNLQVVMITVDPANDTPQIIQHYAASFDPSFVGLGGNSADIAAAAKVFYIGYQMNDPAKATHGDTVTLIDPSGHMSRIYAQDELKHLEGDLSRILKRG